MIQAAAIKLEDKVYTMPRPNRHGHIVKLMISENAIPHLGIQGFITDTGDFVDRSQAAQIAISSGQISKLKYSSLDLFSEDLW